MWNEKILTSLIIRSLVLDSNRCSKIFVSKLICGRSSQISPPTLDLIFAGTGLSTISLQNSLTVFLFFFIVELSESFDNSDDREGFGGGTGTLFLSAEGKQLGRGGGFPRPGNIAGGGGGGIPAAFTAGDLISSSSSCRKSEKSKSQS